MRCLSPARRSLPPFEAGLSAPDDLQHDADTWGRLHRTALPAEKTPEQRRSLLFLISSFLLLFPVSIFFFLFPFYFSTFLFFVLTSLLFHFPLPFAVLLPLPLCFARGDFCSLPSSAFNQERTEEEPKQLVGVACKPPCRANAEMQLFLIGTFPGRRRLLLLFCFLRQPESTSTLCTLGHFDSVVKSLISTHKQCCRKCTGSAQAMRLLHLSMSVKPLAVYSKSH